MALMTVLRTNHIFQQYKSPFREIFPYYLLGLILSGIILLALWTLGWLLRRFPILTQAFPMMLAVERRRLRCFNVDITLTPQYHSIKHASVWILRASVVAILCYLWQSCLLFQSTMSVDRLPAALDVQELCNTGLVCVYYETVYDLLLRYCFGNHVLLCDRDASALNRDAAPSKGFLTCIGIPNVDSLDFAVSAAISYALFKLITGTYQLVAWIVFHSKSPVISILSLVLALLIIALYIAALFIPKLYFSDTWFTSAAYLSLPIIILAGRHAGLAARAVLRERLSVKPTEAAKRESSYSLGAFTPPLKHGDSGRSPAFHSRTEPKSTQCETSIATS